MSKKTIFAAILAMASMPVMAGGLLTNTNQNAAFLRNFAQEGQITLTSLYANPAGNAFLSPGWHMSLNSQTAVQKRNIDTTFPLFPFNASQPDQATHSFQGEAFAPVIPSITVSHNWDRWSLSGHFALTGGGGKCEFDEGLGSFEAIGASMPAQIVSGISGMLQEKGYPAGTANTMASQLGPDRYSLNSTMKGRSYYFGLQIGGAYKVIDNLSAYVGIRGVYATCNYNGFVGDLKLSNSATGATGLPVTMGGTPYVDLVSQKFGGVDPTILLNCDQQGFGVTPIFGLDWEVNKHWNLAVKYEAPTRMNLKNKSVMSDMAALLAKTEQGKALAQFIDGQKVREDIPAILALGAEYTPVEQVRLDASVKTYFDKSARKYGNKEDLLDHNTWEFCGGVEWDCHKLVTVSASWQKTLYGMSDEYMNDLSFNLSSNSIGLGIRLHPSKLFNIDLGYMHTIYGDRTVTTPTALGDKVDVYGRKNNVVGIGFNFAL